MTQKGAGDTMLLTATTCDVCLVLEGALDPSVMVLGMAHGHDSRGAQHTPECAGHGTNRRPFEKFCGPCASSRPLKKRRIPASVPLKEERRMWWKDRRCGCGTVPEGLPKA